MRFSIQNQRFSSQNTVWRQLRRPDELYFPFTARTGTHYFPSEPGTPSFPFRTRCVLFPSETGCARNKVAPGAGWSVFLAPGCARNAVIFRWVSCAVRRQKILRIHEWSWVRFSLQNLYFRVTKYRLAAPAAPRTPRCTLFSLQSQVHLIFPSEPGTSDFCAPGARNTDHPPTPGEVCSFNSQNLRDWRPMEKQVHQKSAL